MSTEKKLRGRSAFITGANQGIGRAIAEAFARQGASLFLGDLRDGNMAAIGEVARAAGSQATHCSLDVTDPDSVERAMGQAEETYGGIDILVNCAGIFEAVKFLDYTLKDWNRILNVNLNGTFLCSQAALRRMAPRGRGKIINLSSVAGKIGGPYRAGYNTSKHAVIGLTRCLAIEFAERGITVNAICPGMVDTEMFDSVLSDVGPHAGNDDPESFRAAMLQRSLQGRMIQPEEIANLAVYLASPESDSMTGQAITLSGGMVMH